LNTSKLSISTLVYGLADAYAIDDQETIAKIIFGAAAADDWATKAFAHTAKLAFETTSKPDAGLRTVVTVTMTRSRTLMEHPEIQDHLDSGNGMAWNLLRVVCQKPIRQF
jgi:hypothetical protein